MKSKSQWPDLLPAALAAIILFSPLSGRAQPVSVTSLATSLFNNTATLNGTVNPNGEDTTAWFEWGSTYAYSNSTPPQIIGNGSGAVAVNAALTSLTQGLTYHYRCVASNSLGLVRGTDQSFWTPIIMLNGANPLTNECHVPFVDPGVTISGPPLAIAAGNNHSLALKADGSVVGWGNNSYGQTNTPISATNVVAIAAGSSHSLALKADGTVVGWGNNASGQTNSPASATNVVAIAATSVRSLALKADGTVVGWGNNSYGQTNTPASAINVAAISAGFAHSLALKADGTVIGWGAGTNYNPGDPFSYGQAMIPASATNVVAISAGGYHSLALKADGTVVGWGNNGSGRATLPAGVTNVVAIAAGYDHSLVLKADGTVIGWGFNNYGQTNTPASATNVVAISASWGHNIVLKADGTVVSWGDGYSIPASVYQLNLPITVTGTVDVDNPGTYPLAYSTTNSLGAVTTAARTVIVTDTLPPVLTLLGGNPLMHVIGTPFVDPGATATDLCAGDRTGNIIVWGTVNTNVAGSNSLVYIASDTSGNVAVTDRTVVIVTRPVLTGLAQLGNGAFHFTFTNTPGAKFNVRATTNVALPFSAWTLLGPVLESPSGVFQFTDITATNHPARFYRAE